MGSVELTGAQGPVPLHADKQRRLLAALVVRAGEALPADVLIDAIWAAAPPATAGKLLQVYVSQLRKLLTPPVAIRTLSGGYVLELGADAVDAARFERLVTDGLEAAAGGNHALACSLLARGLGLWRGPAYGELAYAEFARAESERLEELHLVAFEEWLAAEIALGRHRQQLAEVCGLAHAQPLRERAQALAMLALYRCGRQADALEMYAAMHRRLRDELGLDPGVELRELQRRILQQDHELSGVDAAPAGSPSLPAAPNALIGREREVDELRELLLRDDVRLVVLAGAGGSGKTRLAVEIARVSAHGFANGVVFVALAPLRDPALVVGSIVNACGLHEVNGEDQLEALCAALGGREVLLVLDNFEHLRPAAPIVVALLAAAPRLTVMVTSRAVLHLSGERVYPVAPLAADAAAALFCARAHDADHRFDPDAASQHAIAVICERLDGLPLAIELAAARTNVLTPEQLLDRLDPRLPLLTGGLHDLPARQQTLRATLEWSHDLLSNVEQRLFRRLSVFAGGFELTAVEEVCDGDLDTLGSLVAQSLIYRSPAGRFGMLETLREYALERLDKACETAELRRRHAQWCAEWLRQEAVEILPRYLPAADPSRLSMLTVERHNFRGALDWKAETNEIESIAGLAATLTLWVWIRLGELSEAGRWLQLAHEHLTEYPPPLRADVLSAEVRLAWMRGDHKTGVLLCDEALAIYRQLDDKLGICREMISRGLLAVARDDLAGQRAAFEEAILYARQQVMAGLLITALDCLAYCAMAEGNLDEAQALGEESLTLGVDSGFVPVRTLTNLAHIANVQGRYDDARHFGREALASELAREDWLHSAPVEVAWTLAEQGRHRPAGRLLGAALGFIDQAGANIAWDIKICKERTCTILRDHLNEQTVQALLDEGRRTPLAKAVQDALSESPDTDGMVRANHHGIRLTPV